MKNCKFAIYTANDDYECELDETVCQYGYYIPHIHESRLSSECENCDKPKKVMEILKEYKSKKLQI
jgi:hypothetical protein